MNFFKKEFKKLILSYQSLIKELEKGLLTPYTVEQVQPASMDLRLNENIFLEPKDFTLGSTIEYVNMPKHLVGRVEGKSSYGRLGLAVHITAGFIDPNFKGNITLEFYNFSNKTIHLKRGVNICQLCLEELDAVPEKVYGQCNNHYQGQRNITESYLDNEVDFLYWKD